MIDAATAEIEALDRPEFPSLDLREDVRPAAIAQEILAVNRQIRTAVDAFTPMRNGGRKGSMPSWRSMWRNWPRRKDAAIRATPWC
ncbi:MAG TPA: hypothetical protein VGO55_00400 [Allosphingosinicella sp.]|nr:hypothetical protein [Allosphingosinicella sp.]